MYMSIWRKNYGTSIITILTFRNTGSHHFQAQMDMTSLWRYMIKIKKHQQQLVEPAEYDQIDAEVT